MNLIRFILCIAGSVSLLSCQNFKDAATNVASSTALGATQHRAGGLSPVRADPPTVAYQRLTARAQITPSLKLYLQAKGYPDYVVEQVGIGTSTLVCFYLAKNEAYLVKVSEWSYDKVQIAGPAPIGEKDQRLFKALKELEKAASAYSAPEAKRE